MASGNVLTRKGLNNFLNAGYLGTTDVPTKINVGISTTTPLVSDTALGKKIPISGTETVDDCETADWTDGTDTASALNSTTFKKGSNSLSVAKTGTSGTSATISKTTTSVDFTDKDLWLWLYVEDVSDLVSTGTAVTIRFGSDSSNYYYLDIAVGSLEDGWNAIMFDSSSATGTTGSPVITACDYTALIYNVDDAADTVAADRILLDDVKVASSDDYDRDFDSGYPSVNTVSSEVEMQTTLGTTDAVGYPITELGHLNSSDLLSHSVSSADNKTSSDIFIEVERIKLTNTL